MRVTHTYVLLALSEAAFQEISAKLTLAGYDQAFDDDDENGTTIDMHGIAVIREQPKQPDKPPNG